MAIRLSAALLAAAISIPCSVSARQNATDQGSFLVGGTAGLDQRTTTEQGGREVTSDVLRLAPELQYFLLPGLAVGGMIEYRRMSSDIADPGTQTLSITSDIVGFGPSISYYFGRGARRAHPFVSVSYIDSRIDLENSSGADNTQTMRYVDLAVGVVLMLSGHVGIEGELFWRDGEIEEAAGTTSRSLEDRSSGLRVGVAAFVF